ncbi:MAG: response regulator [Betaproteobacteria bacterium]|nr:response regulator [Betaproteobacteria bacterium]
MTPITWIRTRLAGRTDTEHEQAMLRVLMGIGLLLYLLPDATKHSTDWVYASGTYLVVMAAYMLAAFAVLAGILAWPGASPARRVIANVLDVAGVTFMMVFGEEYTAPLYGVYLWITFGTGFRFGSRYLVSSLVLSAVGFSIVLSVSNYWADNRLLGIGLLGGMVALSLYVLMLIKRLYEAIERAEAANLAKRKFISSVSHELRTPLNAIIGMNDLLCNTTLNAEQSEMAGTMHGASRIMLSLIEDVLDFSKIEAGKITIESTDFDLHALLHSTLAIFSRQAAQKGLKLGVFVMPDVTHAVRGDAHHLRQVLVNLIGNAVKFTEQGEVRLAVSALTESQQSARLRFAVRDTGIGIPQAEHQRIFESFTQADSPGDRKHRGTGLGTTISKQLVDLMGGSIGLESAPGAGSTFWFDLPFTKQDVAAVESRARFKETRALLVGFPEEAQQALAADLRQWEMETSSAESLAIATARLSEAAALGRPYRVALVYADNASANIGDAATRLRAHDSGSLALILCAPRNAAALWSSRMPAEFASVIGLPPEKRLLYNALHSVLAGAETAAGAISLADYYQRKEPTRSYRVLAADDDAINRTVLAKQLEMAGHTAKLVADGEQALDALGEADYDVVILDSHMPVMTGLEATRLIRVMQAGRAGVPIILFSADSTPETIQEATDAGVDVFLPKPVEASRLYATIEQLAEKRSREKARVVQAIAPSQLAHAPLLNTKTLRDLEQMSQDPQFVDQLVQMFGEDSSQLLMKIEETLSRHRHEEFKTHVHALKGSALNLGAERLFAHCTRIGALNYRALSASAGSVAAETRTIVTQTQAALADYVKNHSVASS